MTTTAAAFPRVSARTLDGRRVALPADFAGAPTVAVAAFHRTQQADAESWVQPLIALQAAHPEMRTYGLPTLPPGARMLRPVIESALRAGIPDEAIRAVTIPLFTNVGAFVRAVGLADDTRLAVLVLAPDGRVTWRTTGPYTPAAGRALADAVAALGARHAATR